MQVWVLYLKAVVDVTGEMLEHAEIIDVFDSLEGANAAYDSFKESYMRRKSDLEIEERELKVAK